MAGTFSPTGTYSNLTRLELEQLRRADFFAGGKALTVGDSALPPEGVVGKGDVNAEPFLTNPTIVLDQVFPLTPPQQPGPGLATVTQVANVPSETVRWFGPTFQVDGNQGAATSTTVWTDTSGVNFTLFVNPGDILLIKPKLSPTDKNSNCVGTVASGGVTATTLTLININNPTNLGHLNQLDNTSAGADKFEYVVVRPNAVQLFAMPGSGATGFEQTFLMVKPGSTLHNTVAPTINAINADRIKNIIPAQYALNTSVDRADAVFDAPGPRTSLDLLGYRVILYPDNGLGTGPNLATPITAIDPVISTTIPITDQRATIDFEAGIVRLSCEPSLGGQIKVAGGVNGVTGRLNLYAVFWAVDLTLTIGNARGLYGLRSTNQNGLAPGRVTYDATDNAWRIGSTNSTNAAFVRAPDLTDDPTGKTEFGAFDGGSPRSFIYRAGVNSWHFIRNPPASSVDDPSFQELVVADKTMGTVGDGSNPPIHPGEYLQTTTSTVPGMRDASVGILTGLKTLYGKGYGELHLNRGQFNLQEINQPIAVPPGIVITGEGETTVVRGYTNSAFLLGPNTPWGVYDPDYDQVNGYAASPTTTFPFTSTETLEGVDMVWNPTRRVWGVAHVDLTLNAVFFNEVLPSGVTNLPGLGINIKDSANNIFIGDGGTSAGYTRVRGHMPRVAYAPATDQYVVAWVESVVSGLNHVPHVFAQVVQPTQLYPSIVLGTQFPNAQRFDSLNAAYQASSDVPSVAMDPRPITTFVGVSYFAISFGAGGLGGACTVQIWDTNLGNAGVNYAHEDYPVTFNLGFVSSTDVSMDDGTNVLAAWSEHDHPIICGTAGSISGSSTLTDPSAATPWNNPALGLIGNERVLFLGGGSIAGQGNLGVVGYIADNPISAGASLTVRQLNNGGTPGNPGMSYIQDLSGTIQWALVGGSTIHGALIPSTGLASWTPALGQTFYNGVFTTAGTATVATSVDQRGIIMPGMRLTFAAEPGVVYVVKVVNGANIVLSTVTASSTATTASRIGAQFDYTVTGPGANGVGATTTPRELDYVRLSYGGGQWLLVCQAFNTTNLLSITSLPNFDGSQNTSFPETAAGLTLTNQIPVGSPYVYRHHLSTCGFVIGPSGQVADKIIPAPYGLYSVGNTLAGYGLNVTESFYVANSRHDLFNSNLSLGSRPPTTSFPNSQEFTLGLPTASSNKAYAPYGNTPLISPRNIFYRWGQATSATGLYLQAQPPSNIPDVTWSGSDWTVVSPAKTRIESDTGTYFTNGGQFYLTDATFYWGTGASNTIDGNFLRQTVVFSGAFVYIPSATPGSQYQPVTVIDEHTVKFNLGAVPGLSSVTSNLVWHFVNQVPLGVPGYGGAKTPGYRVGPDGKVIVSSWYTTFADELLEAQTQTGNTFVPQDDTYRARIAFKSLAGVFTLSASTSVTTSVSQVGIVVPGQSHLIFSNQVGSSYSVTSVTSSTITLTSSYSGTTGPSQAIQYPFAAGTGCVGDANTEFGPPGVPQQFPWYTGSRVQYDVGFHGVGVGAPKGMNELGGLGLSEPPMCAIAWGENFFGFLDRELSGLNPSYTNRTIFYRQSFGPFRNGLKNMRIEQAEGAGGKLLSIRSRYPVVTRHGHPASASGSFATDGFRNFFITPTFRAVTFPGSQNANGNYDISIQMVVTDALGNNPIRSDTTDLSGFFSGGANGINMQWLSDIKSFSLSSQPGKVSPISPAKSAVIWNGVRPVVFSIVSGPLNLQFAQAGYRNLYLCMTQLPGGEDNERVGGEEMIGDFSTFTGEDLTPSEIARVSCGCGNIAVPVTFPTAFNEPTTQIAAAYSGKTYAVLWAAGLNCGSDNNLGYNQLGITIFTGTGTAGVSGNNVTSGGSAATFTITKFFANGVGRAVLSHPKIVWDGKMYVCTWLLDENPSISASRYIETCSVPEYGFATPQQLKATGNPWTATGGTNQGALGQFVATSGSYTQRMTMAANVSVQPGDIIHVLKQQPEEGGEGSYQVIDAEYDFGAGKYYAYLINVSTANVNSFDIFAGSSPQCYGFITSGGVTSQLTSDNAFPQSLFPFSNQVSSDPTVLNQTYSASFQKNSGITDTNGASDVMRLGGLLYDEKSDNYTLMYHSCPTTPSGSQPTSIFLCNFRKSGLQFGQEAVVGVTANGQHNVASAFGWNGRHYLVVYTDFQIVIGVLYTSMIRYVLLSDKFQIVEQGVLDEGNQEFPPSGPQNPAFPQAISYSPGSMPGPLYQNYINPNMSVQARNLEVVWNPRLNRWVVSAAYLWSTDSSVNAASHEIDFFPTTNWGNVTSYTGTTLNVTSPGRVSPGQRVGWVDSTGTIQVWMTVIEGGVGGTSFIVDVASTEIASSHLTGITTNVYTSHVLPREDIFCWTIGYNNPAVLVQDADETFIDNVTIGGGTDIEEKYLRMAQPTWQAASSPQGMLGSFTIRHGQYFNHLHLTPAGKIETLRLTNYRSRTRVKYGHDMLAGTPTQDRYTFNTANRRT